MTSISVLQDFQKNNNRKVFSSDEEDDDNIEDENEKKGSSKDRKKAVKTEKVFKDVDLMGGGDFGSFLLIYRLKMIVLVINIIKKRNSKDKISINLYQTLKRKKILTVLHFKRSNI